MIAIGFSTTACVHIGSWLSHCARYRSHLIYGSRLKMVGYYNGIHATSTSVGMASPARQYRSVTEAHVVAIPSSHSLGTGTSELGIEQKRQC